MTDRHARFHKSPCRRAGRHKWSSRLTDGVENRVTGAGPALVIRLLLNSLPTSCFQRDAYVNLQKNWCRNRPHEPGRGHWGIFIAHWLLLQHIPWQTHTEECLRYDLKKKKRVINLYNILKPPHENSQECCLRENSVPGNHGIRVISARATNAIVNCVKLLYDCI